VIFGIVARGHREKRAPGIDFETGGVAMIIRCDGCAKEISKEAAIIVQCDDEVFHFCSAACEARKTIVEPQILDEEERDEVPEGSEAWGTF
jgi:hypothetical protein